MIALDLDGTLAIENHQVLPKTRSALENLHHDGVEVGIATGRRYRTTRFVIENLGFEVYAVCNGGALVKTPEQETLHKDTFNVAPIARIAREIGLTVFAQRDAHSDGGSDFMIDETGNWNPPMSKYFEDNQEFSSTGNLIDSKPEFLVSGMFGPDVDLRKFSETLHDQLPESYNTIIVPQPNAEHFYCEISQRHVNKWHGLTRLASHFKITANNICTVGDELNDMSMIQAVPHGVAMANGNKELQDNARFVCGHNTEDGIVEVVDYILEHNAGCAE